MVIRDLHNAKGANPMKLKTTFVLTLLFVALPSLTYPLQSASLLPEIEVNHLQITPTNILPKDMSKITHKNELKIAHFSDLHLKQGLDLSLLNQTIAVLKAENPDIICFTGDFLDANDLYLKDTQPIINALQFLTPRYGKYAVLGNHDLTASVNNKSLQLLEAGGFKVLQDQKVELIYEEFPIALSGIHSILSKQSSADVLKTLDTKHFNIFLVHEPDSILEFSKYPIQLQLSGHTHGGQIKFKNLPLTLPPSGELYVEGPYCINDVLLNVNIGIGYSRLNLRIQCPSTIDMLYLDTASFS